jgi:hypothetical protein
MFPLGHLGIGLELASPFDKGLPRKIILLGTLLPDLLDKSLYYSLSLATGLRGDKLWIIGGTRSFGHTFLFTATLALLARTRRSRFLAALALGTATHLLLDLVTDVCEMGVGSPRIKSISLKALIWPLLGWRFPFAFGAGMHDHLGRIHEPFILYAEILGILLLIWEWRKYRRTAANA